jgi:hypothetical protein
MFRALCAMPFLLVAYACLMLAYRVCPSLKEKDTPTQGATWLDAPEGWDEKVN